MPQIPKSIRTTYVFFGLVMLVPPFLLALKTALASLNSVVILFQSASVFGFVCALRWLSAISRCRSFRFSLINIAGLMMVVVTSGVLAVEYVNGQLGAFDTIGYFVVAPSVFIALTALLHKRFVAGIATEQVPPAKQRSRFLPGVLRLLACIWFIVIGLLVVVSMLAAQLQNDYGYAAALVYPGNIASLLMLLILAAPGYIVLTLSKRRAVH